MSIISAGRKFRKALRKRLAARRRRVHSHAQRFQGFEALEPRILLNAPGVISGVTFNDLNADGIQNPNEPGLAAVTVYLDDNDDGALNWTDANANNLWDDGEGERWTVSDADGAYAFDGLAAGDYLVAQVVPGGRVQSFPQTEPIGDTFTVTEFSDLGEGALPVVSKATDGSYVVVWQGPGQDDDDQAIFARRFDALDQPLTDAFQVSQNPSVSQADAEISHAADGSFVITWTQENQNSSGDGIYARRYSADGQALGDSFLVNQQTGEAYHMSTVSHAPDGGFVVVWVRWSFVDDAQTFDIAMRRFDADGTALSDEQAINEYESDAHAKPAVSHAEDGSFVVVWNRRLVSGEGYHLYARRFDVDGQAVGESFRVNAEGSRSHSDATIAHGPSGAFVIAWMHDAPEPGNRDIHARRFNAAGTPLGTEFLVNQYTANTQDQPDVSFSSDGTFVIVWHGYTPEDGNDYSLYAQRYDAIGRPLGDTAQVNQDLSRVNAHASVAHGPEGDFVVVWYSRSLEQHGTEAVYARRFDIDPHHHITVDPGQHVNTINFGSFASTSIGNFVWHDNNRNGIQDDDEPGIDDVTVRLLSATGEPIDTTLTINGGQYAFRALDAGEYIIEFVLPDELVFTPRHAPGATDKTDSDADAATGRTDIIHLSDGEYLTGFDAGMAPALSTITGTVWNDLNADGVRDINEPGLAAVTVYLDDNDDGALNWTDANANNLWDDGEGERWTVSDADGAYAFDGLAAGDYRVAQLIQLGFSQIHHTIGWTDAIRVNDYTESTQDRSRIVHGPDGSYLVAWSSWRQDGVGYGVFAKRYDQNGEPLSDEFLINQTTSGSEFLGDVAMANDGSFVVTWTRGELYDGSKTIYARRFDASGQPLGDEILVSQDATDVKTWPNISLATDGSFVVVWCRTFPDTNAQDIFMRRYDASGQPLSDVTGVNEYRHATQIDAEVAHAPDGNFVITWAGNGPGDVDGVFARRFDSDGQAAGSEFLVNQTTTGSQASPALSYAPDGTFLIAWRTTEPENDGTDIHARRFDADGQALTDEFKINEQDAGYQNSPDITHDAAGGFVVVWQTSLPNGNGYNTYARRFNADGMPVERDMAVNTELTTHGAYPNVSAAPDGDFVVVWEVDDEIITSHNNINMRQYTARFTHTITVQTNDIINDADFANHLTSPASIGDTVWHDLNANGVQDANEPGIEGVTVNLLDSEGHALRSTVSTGEGKYIFDDLAPGDFIVEFILPQDALFTARDQGADDAADSDAHISTGRSAAISVGPDEVNTDIDAGILTKPKWHDLSITPQPASEGSSAALTAVFTDFNGHLQSHEMLVDWGDGTTSTFIADPGEYTFNAEHTYANDGTYTINATLTNAANLSDSATITAEVVNVLPVILTVGPDFVAFAGSVQLYATADDPGDDTVTYVWDLDDDGLFGEVGVDAEHGDETGATPTFDATGLQPLQIWEVRVRAYDDLGYSEAATYVEVGDLASISNFVWHDLNGNGIQDDDEPGIDGVLVNLLNATGDVIATTTTEDGGQYLFKIDTTGNYAVAVELPNHYQFTTANVGADDAIDSDVDPDTGRTDVLTVSTHTHIDTIDTGLTTNTPPIAVDDYYVISSGETLKLTIENGLLSNDTDANGDDLIVYNISKAKSGTLAGIAGDLGTFYYTPDDGFYGRETFVYAIEDKHGGTAEAMFTIDVAYYIDRMDEPDYWFPEGDAQFIDVDDNAVAQLSEGSDAAILTYIDFPDDAGALSFKYRVTQAGDGDRLIATFNGEEIFSTSIPDNVDPDNPWLTTGPIDITRFAAQDGVLDIRLASAGQTNAQVHVDDVAVTATDVETIQFDKKNKAQYIDADGDLVTVTLAGDGEGVITKAFGNADAISIVLTNTTDRTNLTVKTANNAKTSVADILAEGAVRNIIAKTTDLRDDLFVDSANNIHLADLQNQHTIFVGPSVDPRKQVSFTFGRIQDLELISHMAIRSFTATEWIDTDVEFLPDYINAPSLDNLTIKGDPKDPQVNGDFHASLVLVGNENKKYTLSSAKINGDLSGEWYIVGSANRIDAKFGTADQFLLAVENEVRSVQLGIVNLAFIGIGGEVIDGKLGTLQVSQFNAGLVTAGSIKNLISRADRKNEDAFGDFFAEVQITGLTDETYALSKAQIDGHLAGPWEIFGDINTIDADNGIVADFSLLAHGDIKTLRLGRIESADIVVGDEGNRGEIGTLDVTQFNTGSVIAGSINKLNARNDRKDDLANGDWLVDLTLTGNGYPRYTLATATIAGDLAGTWDITGDINKIDASKGVVDDFTLAVHSDVNHLKLGRVEYADITIGDKGKRGMLKKLEVTQFNAGSVTAGVINTITSRDNRKDENANGDFLVDVTVTGIDSYTKPSVNTVRITGDLAGAWDVAGDINTIDASKGVTDNFTLDAHDNVKQLKLGRVDHATITVGDEGNRGILGKLLVTQFNTGTIIAGAIDTITTRDNRNDENANGDFMADVIITGDNLLSKGFALKTVNIAGRVIGALFEVESGDVNSFTAGTIENSQLRVGVSDSVTQTELPDEASDFTANAGVINRLTVRGLRGVDRTDPSFINSIVAAFEIGSVSLKVVQTDNSEAGNALYGLSATSIGRITATDETNEKLPKMDDIHTAIFNRRDLRIVTV